MGKSRNVISNTKQILLVIEVTDTASILRILRAEYLL